MPEENLCENSVSRLRIRNAQMECKWKCKRLVQGELKVKSEEWLFAGGLAVGQSSITSSNWSPRVHSRPKQNVAICRLGNAEWLNAICRWSGSRSIRQHLLHLVASSTLEAVARHGYMQTKLAGGWTDLKSWGRRRPFVVRLVPGRSMSR